MRKIFSVIIHFIPLYKFLWALYCNGIAMVALKSVSEVLLVTISHFRQNRQGCRVRKIVFSTPHRCPHKFRGKSFCHPCLFTPFWALFRKILYIFIVCFGSYQVDIRLFFDKILTKNSPCQYVTRSFFFRFPAPFCGTAPTKIFAFWAMILRRSPHLDEVSYGFSVHVLVCAEVEPRSKPWLNML